MITERLAYLLRRPAVLPGIILAISVMCFCPSHLGAQTDQQQRPKLGLALSGGGAKGLAHVGVIKVMEEAGLRPDYITGVSMGSIVGAMYAVGYSPDSIAAMFGRYDWGTALSDRIAENKIIFLEKKNFHNSLISLPVTRNKILIPSGLINGQQIEAGLNYYFWPALCITDFSKLPIPFLCVATDILSSSRVVLRSGYLSDAIRASMSIPTVFTPVKTDTALLVDGGVVRNYAVSELREMGADIVIGSYVSFRGASGEDLETVYGILKQIGLLTSFADYEEQKQLTDIMIEPELKGISTLAFTNIDSIISIGYRSAVPYRERFRKLADSLNAIGPQEPFTPLPERNKFKFDRIYVTGNETIKADQIIGVLDIKPGDQVDREMLAEKIDLLYGKVWFEKVKYRVINRNDSVILQIDCIERPKAMLYGSLHYNLALGPGVVFNLSARDLVTNKSVINLESFISQYYRLKISAMQFLDKSQKVGMEGFFYTDNTRLPLIRLRDEIGPMLSQNVIIGLALSKRLSLNHLMSFTATSENQYMIPDYITSTHIKKLSYKYLNLGFVYQANTLDYKYFPDRGINYCISLSSSKLLRGIVKTDTLKHVYSREDASPFSFDRFYSARASFITYTSPSEKVTLNFGGDILISTNVSSVTSNNNLHYLGGIEAVTDRSLPAFGFHANQIAVRNMAGVRFGADLEISKGLFLTFGSNIFAIQEPDREEGATLMGGYGLGAGYMTVAGPIRIGIMHGIYNREILYKQVKGYVSIGFAF